MVGLLLPHINSASYRFSDYSAAPGGIELLFCEYVCDATALFEYVCDATTLFEYIYACVEWKELELGSAFLWSAFLWSAFLWRKWSAFLWRKWSAFLWRKCISYDE